VVLLAIENDHRERVRSARPIDARGVVLAGLVALEPNFRAALHIDDTDANGGIGVARLWDADAIPGRMAPAVIGELDHRFLRLVDLPIRDVPAVGRPRPRLCEAKLFLVYPIEMAVEYVLGGVARETSLLLRPEI